MECHKRARELKMKILKYLKILIDHKEISLLTLRATYPNQTFRTLTQYLTMKVLKITKTLRCCKLQTITQWILASLESKSKISQAWILPQTH